jgi:transposase InsO family protein
LRHSIGTDLTLVYARKLPELTCDLERIDARRLPPCWLVAGPMNRAMMGTEITAADLLNDRVLPFFEEHDVKLLRVLTDRGSEFCGNPERHEYELYLAVEDIDHSRTKTKSPQTNGICERFHKTALNEFYRVAFRKKVYRSIDELQADLDAWIKEYNEARPHQGRWCFGKTPMQTFLDALPMTKEKMIAA